MLYYILKRYFYNDDVNQNDITSGSEILYKILKQNEEIYKECLEQIDLDTGFNKDP